MTRRRPSSDPGARPLIGIVDGSDGADLGALLMPELARHELEVRIGPILLQSYGHQALRGTDPPHEIRSLETLREEIPGLDLLLIGGGAVGRFERDVTDEHPSATTPEGRRPTDRWLAPTLSAAAAGVPVAWSGVAVAAPTPAWAAPLLAELVGVAADIAVRDRAALDALSAIAPGAAIRQVPDPTFGVGALTGGLDAERLATIRRDLGLAAPYVVIEAAAQLEPWTVTLRNAVRSVVRAGRQVLVAAVSPSLGERIATLDLGPDVVAAPVSRPPLDTAALIAGAEGVVAYSTSVVVIALAHGVPVFRSAASPSSGDETLARFGGLSTFGPAAQTLGARLASAHRAAPGPELADVRSRLTDHWDRVARLVGPPVERPAPRWDVLSRVLTVVPAAFDDLATAHAIRTGERDDLLARLKSIADDRDRSDGAPGKPPIPPARPSPGMPDASDDRDALRARAQVGAQELVAAGQRLAELQARLDQVIADGRAAEERAASTNRHLREELALRDAKLSDLNAQTARLKKELAKARGDFDRIRQRRSVRAALRVAGIARRVRVAFRSPPRSGDQATQARDAVRKRRSRREASRAEQQELGARIVAQLPRSERRSGPVVSIVVLTRDGREHLARLMAALEKTTYRSFEVIVIDNDSSDGSAAFLEDLRPGYPLRVQVNPENRSFAEGCNQGLRDATGDFVLLLNNDIEPISPGWLGRMVTTLEEEAGAVAVGARLVYPARPGLDNAGDRTYDDLTLQHRGVAFGPADGVPVARNLGAGDDPLSGAAAGTREAPALTGACLLVDRRALEAVGGLTEGYLYGTEDVDLCLKLRAAGGRLIYDGGAALWHHEYATQNAAGAAWKRANRRTNRQLFVDRWGPQLFREVFVDRLRSEGRWSEDPLHLAITVTRDDPAAGYGDYYTAHELGEACERLGWRVSYLERYAEAWYEPDPTVDVVVALLDAYDITRLPRHIVTVAWVRNWTDRWLGHPWFGEYDLVFASSEGSRRLIDARSSTVAQLMPLATNPERFTRTPVVDELAADVLFAGNHWAVPRDVLATLPSLAREIDVKVFGTGWEQTSLAPLHRGALPYERLPEAYSSARIVLDDTASHTKPYGAVNSRVFDALAAGSLVISDNEAGIRELFDEDFPVARDAAACRRLVEELLADPDRADALAARYRDVVLERHTYARRADQLRSALISWAEAERAAILIGVPDRSQVKYWGDFHFAHGLKRQLARQGIPSRVELLPEWPRAVTARQDVALHLFGLSEHRVRPSQINVLWVISHPDLVRDGLCDRYDQVFVASDQFAAGLASRVRAPVAPLHQATDPDRFRPEPIGPSHDVLYVANSRKNRRRVIDDLRYTGVDVAVYGRQWTPDMIDMDQVRGEHIPNEILHQYYSAAKIVLNDHWDDMRRNGFFANRLYDALAAGAFVISDAVPGIEEEFDGAVITYEHPEELPLLIEHFLGNDPERRERAERGRAAVLDRHTFAHRARSIDALLDPIRGDYPRVVTGLPRIEAWITRRSRRAGSRDPVGVIAADAASRRTPQPDRDPPSRSVVAGASASSRPDPPGHR